MLKDGEWWSVLVVVWRVAQRLVRGAAHSVIDNSNSVAPKQALDLQSFLFTYTLALVPVSLVKHVIFFLTFRTSEGPYTPKRNNTHAQGGRAC